jgi:hypothetical protein
VRLLAEDAQIETKCSNEGDLRQSEASECLGSSSSERIAMVATMADLSSEWAQK